MAASIVDQSTVPDAAGPVAIKKLGVVNVGYVGNPGVANRTNIVAGFTDYSGASASLERSTIGPCELSFGSGGSPPMDSGQLSLSGGFMSETLMYEASGYPPLSLLETVWPAGFTVSVSATGATVPAWSASVVMPQVASIAAPDLASIPTWSRTSDVTFTWQGGTHFVTITVGSVSGLLECHFPATASSGTIPAAALAKLPPGMAVVSGSSTNRTVTNAGDWEISLIAAHVPDPSNLYRGQVVLQ
jgi:hypothetical protein